MVFYFFCTHIMTVSIRKACHVAPSFRKKKYTQFGIEATLWNFGRYQV